MIISEYLKQILVCPRCHMELLLSNGDFECSVCGKVGKIEKGVLNFISPCEKSAQTAFYKNDEYKKGIRKLKEMHRLHYNSNSLSGRLEKYFKDELLKIVINPQRPFFDIGCGTGTGFRHFGYPEEIVGIDISLELLQICKESFPKADCICCDITHPPIRQNSLKTVFSIETLEHIFYLERFLESIERLLSSDGYFYVLIPTEGSLAWSLLRNLAHIKYSKALNINYKKVFKKEHCNKADTIDNALNKFFEIELVRNIPWRVGGNNLNLVKLYRLRKRC